MSNDDITLLEILSNKLIKNNKFVKKINNSENKLDELNNYLDEAKISISHPCFVLALAQELDKKGINFDFCEFFDYEYKTELLLRNYDKKYCLYSKQKIECLCNGLLWPEICAVLKYK